MRSKSIKRGLAVLAGLVIVAAIAVAALPFVASTQIVKDRIAHEISIWSGYQVTLGDDPELEVWPSIRAIVRNVELSPWASDDGLPVLTSETLEIDLSPFSALRGKIVPLSVRFVRPLLRVKPGKAALAMPRAPLGGKIMRAVQEAEAVVARNAATPDLGLLSDEPGGTVEFLDGRIVEQSGDKKSEVELLSSISGGIQWPTMNRDLSFQIQAIWRGENISLTGDFGTPLVLFAGGVAPVRISMNSAPLKMSFNGTADMNRPLFMSGDITLDTPSLDRALEWSGTAPSPGIAVGPASIAGRLSGQSRRLKIENAQVAFGGNPGMGVIEMALDGSVPSISGSLAFNDLDLVAFLSAFTVLPLGPDASNGSLESALIDAVNMDLRLSAKRAKAGPVNLADVAAAVQIKDRLITFDISDATAFGGNLVTGIRVDRKRGVDIGEFRLLVTEIDGNALAGIAGLERLVPRARGKLSVILHGPLTRPAEFLNAASGSISASFTQGAIPNLNLQAFLARARDGGFFSLEEVSKGSMAFERAELKATMADGVAHIERAVLNLAQRQIELAGIVPYLGKSLALSGKVSAIPVETGSDGVIFFVGGSWNAPFISAVLPAEPYD